MESRGDAPMAVTPPEAAAGTPEASASQRGAKADAEGSVSASACAAGHAARGARLASEGRHDEAVKAYTHALVQQPNDVAILLSRARAFLMTAEAVSCRPASEADMDRRSGPGDSHTLAGLALRDVDRAFESGSCSTDQMITGYLLRGHSRFTTEDYTAALDAYSDGLTFDPMHSELLACVRKTRTKTNQRRLKRTVHDEPRGAQSDLARGEGAAAASPRNESDTPGAGESGSTDERGRKSLACPLCKELIFDPITAPTGNSFCRYCLQRALAETPVCPVTQKVIHMNARRFPVSVSLQSILTKLHADETARRATAVAALKEEHSEEPCDVLPLYALDYVLPGQTMALNMFEPRYRLMTRRCMDGDRKFGMLGVRPDPVHRPGESARMWRNVGTEVEIVESKQMFDGRCHIQVKALQRFEVISTKELDGYRCANVRFFKDEPTDDEKDTSVPSHPGKLTLQEEVREVEKLSVEWLRRGRVLSVHSAHLAVLLRQIVARSGPPPQITSIEAYSFWVGNLVPTSTAEKLQMLNVTSTAQRLAQLKLLLKEIIVRTCDAFPASPSLPLPVATQHAAAANTSQSSAASADVNGPPVGASAEQERPSTEQTVAGSTSKAVADSGNKKRSRDE